MKYRLLAALLGLVMAGCTSQQQQPSLSYSSAAMPPPAEPALAQSAPSTALPVPASPSGTTQTMSAAGFPAPPSCEASSLEPSCAPAMQEKKCRTVGSVTTCDVPADPAADSRLYTN